MSRTKAAGITPVHCAMTLDFRMASATAARSCKIVKRWDQSAEVFFRLQKEPLRVINFAGICSGLKQLKHGCEPLNAQMRNRTLERVRRKAQLPSVSADKCLAQH